jgi:ubiquinone/menaquinone biosynthesis C-methylase UbiE
MPTLLENKEMWDSVYQWDTAGDEWSKSWGGPLMQWNIMLYPRIHHFLPADTILEIAPGYGRFTQFLKDYTKNLIVVDISEKCIEACKNRFSNESNIKYFVNDGKSLHMIEDDSVDFVFSFDSLVFVEENDLREYIVQLSKKLKRNGAIFIHHSNLGAYWYYSKLSKKWIKIIRRFRIIEDDYWRAYSVSAEKVKNICNSVGLACIVQELVPWFTRKTFVDCFSLIVHQDSEKFKKPRVYRNRHFMDTSQHFTRLFKYYGNTMPVYDSQKVTYDTVSRQSK